MKYTVEIDERIVRLAKRAWAVARHRTTLIGLGTLVLVGAGALAHATPKKHTFSAGTPALASEVNENFDDLFAAVTALENAFAADRQRSVTLAGSTINGGFAISNGGYVYTHPDTADTTFGQVAVQIPAGSTVTAMSCSVYNNSDIGSGADGAFSANLRYSSLTDIEVTQVSALSVWPSKQDAIQSFDAGVTAANATLPEDAALFLQIGLNHGSATNDEYYPPNAACTECRRVLRHYGCRIDYELP